MFRCLSVAVTAICFFIFVPAAFPHGGGLDSNGGHYNRKTGVYHSHRPRRKPISTPQPRVPPASSLQFRRTSPTRKATPKAKSVTRAAKPKGRIWHGRNGKRLAKGSPTSFDKKTCKISLDDGVHQGLTVLLEDLSVVDVAYTLGGFRRSSKYYSHRLKWVSKSGLHVARATPLLIDEDSVLLLMSDHRIVDVPISELDSASIALAIELRQASGAAKSLVSAVEPNPFDGGVLIDVDFEPEDADTASR